MTYCDIFDSVFAEWISRQHFHDSARAMPGSERLERSVAFVGFLRFGFMWMPKLAGFVCACVWTGEESILSQPYIPLPTLSFATM